MSDEISRVRLHKLRLNIIDSNIPQILDMLKDSLSSYKGKFAIFMEGNLLSHFLQDKAVRACIRNADFVFPDGVSVSKLASVTKKSHVCRISGPTFILKACEYGQALGWRHFFYGGTPETLDKLINNLKSKYPDLQIAGTYVPPFRPLNASEEQEVKELIENSNADFLWVGLGGPKQEFWILEHQDKINVPIMLGVGAAFDFHSGVRPWAPAWIRKVGFEWLWRMLSGGRKTFIRNIRCVFHCSLYYLIVKFHSLELKFYTIIKR